MNEIILGLSFNVSCPIENLLTGFTANHICCAVPLPRHPGVSDKCVCYDCNRILLAMEVWPLNVLPNTGPKNIIQKLELPLYEYLDNQIYCYR